MKNELKKIIRCSVDFKNERIEVCDLLGKGIFNLNEVSFDDKFDIEEFSEKEDEGTLNEYVADNFREEIKTHINPIFIDNEIIGLDNVLDDSTVDDMYKISLSNYSPTFYYVAADGLEDALEVLASHLILLEEDGELCDTESLQEESEDIIDNSYTYIDCSRYIKTGDHIRYAINEHLQIASISQ